MIDALLRYCLTEIAYEGELGCTFERLKELIAGYAQQQTANTRATHSTAYGEGEPAKKPNIDNAYCEYVYSRIVSRADIIVGTVPPGTPPVWIAPPVNKRARGERPPPLSLTPIEDAKMHSMTEMIRQHGPGLRIAATTTACFVALTGSHTRPSKLSDVVYTVLQIIVRSREAGIAIKDLGSITKYDPKSIYYQIQALEAMDLIVKVSKGPNLNWAVFKHFYDRSEFWQKLRSGVGKAAKSTASTKDADAEISNELLPNISLLRRQVLSVVAKSKNQIHQKNNLIVAAGYSKPERSQRRFFTARVNDMIEEGLLDKVAVPSANGNVICLQLTEKGGTTLAELEGTRSVAKVAEEDNEMEELEFHDEDIEWKDENRFERGMGLQRQLIACLEKEPEGLTIKELSSRLSQFDTRTIEQVLTRLCSRIPPRHLVDLHPVTTMETLGKIRRQRYFTLLHYQKSLQNQGLTDERYDWVDMKDVGDFAPVDEKEFWTSKSDLYKFIDEFQISRGRRPPTVPGTYSASRLKKLKNPIVNGVVKRGRPRKEWTLNKDNPPPQDASAGNPLPAEGLPSKGIGDAINGQEAVALPPGGPTDTRISSQSTSLTLNTPAHLATSDLSIPTGSGLQPSAVDVNTPDNTSPKKKRSVSSSKPSDPKSPTKKSKKRSAEEAPGTEPAKKKRKTTKTKDGQPIAPVVQGVPPESTVVVQDAPQEIVFQVTLPQEAAEPNEGGRLSPVMPSSPTTARVSAKRRQKLPKPKATNVSALRRNQQLLEVLRENGGILQVNHELSVLLQEHSKKLAEQGFQGGQDANYMSDKKTISRSVEMLEETGEIKVIRTAIVDPGRKSSLQQPTIVIHFPDLDADTIKQYLAGIQKQYKPIHLYKETRVIEEEIEFSRGPKRDLPKKPQAKTGPMDLAKVVGPRHKFLADRQTVAQLFGFLLGKSRRAQELYLFTLNDILSANPSPSVLSVEERIVCANYWTEDFPLGSFCAIIPAHSYISYLEYAQGDPEALNQPLKSLELRLQRALKVKHATTRSRLFELLNTLTELGLVTPLEAVEDGSGSKEERPHQFVPMNMPTAPNSDLPRYWKFNTIVPLWIISLGCFNSAEVEEPPPLHKYFPIPDVPSAVSYWSLLNRFCHRRGDIASLQQMISTTQSAICAIGPSVMTSLFNPRSWISTYCLSKLQVDYLKDMIDITTLTTPLDDPTSERLMQAAYITCAPQQVVYEFFTSHAEKLASVVKRMESRKGKSAAETEAELRRRAVEKAERHLISVEERWEELLDSVFDYEISQEAEEQLRLLRSRFITVGGLVDEEKVKGLIANIVRDPVDVARKRNKRMVPRAQVVLGAVPMEHLEDAMPSAIAQQSSTTEPNVVNNRLPDAPISTKTYPPLPPLVSRPGDRTVAQIIASMGTPLESSPKKRLRKAGNDVEAQGPKKTYRRRRFVWNEEYDDLLKDAAAIIRARSRGRSRAMTWKTVTPAFPTMSENGTRLRFAKYLSQPGAAAYLDRLEQAWFTLWQTHKGRPELPDEDPSKPEGCDILVHIQFLRHYLDKRNLQESVPVTEGTVAPVSEVIPLTVDQLRRHYRTIEKEDSDFDQCISNYWGDASNYYSERNNSIASVCFSEQQPPRNSGIPLSQAVAQNVIQMIVATEPEDYTEEVATALLIPFGDARIKAATETLSKRGSISKVAKNKASKSYRMSEANTEELTGKFSQQRCEDAAAIETVYEEEPDDWRIWPMAPSEGEMAALLQRVSRHQVDFKWELPDLELLDNVAQAANRKLLEENFETEIAVCFDFNEAPEAKSRDASADVDPPEGQTSDKPHHKQSNVDVAHHGVSDAGETAACMLTQPSGALVNCAGCLSMSQRMACVNLPQTQAEHLVALVQALKKAGENGLPAADVWSLPSSEVTVPAMMSSLPPLAFWSGYSESRFISSHYLSSYAVWLSEETTEAVQFNTKRLVMPRRWIDLRGRMVISTWKSCVRAVVGLILLRPLVDQPRIVENFVHVYDRLDIVAALRHLEDNEIVDRTHSQTLSLGPHRVGEMTVEEERVTFWRLTKKLDWALLL